LRDFLPPADFLQNIPSAAGISLSGSEVTAMAKVLTLPIKPEMPDPTRRKAKPRQPDPRYVEGQRLLIDAMKYLIQQDPQLNKDAVSLISEHFRTRFRMSDRPVDLPNFSPELK
jgi:hypothetical protein